MVLNNQLHAQLETSKASPNSQTPHNVSSPPALSIALHCCFLHLDSFLLGFYPSLTLVPPFPLTHLTSVCKASLTSHRAEKERDSDLRARALVLHSRALKIRNCFLLAEMAYEEMQVTTRRY